MSDVIDEINDRLDNSFNSSDLEIKEPHLEERNFEYYQKQKLDEAPKLCEEVREKKNKEIVDDFTGEVRRFRSSAIPGTYESREVCTQESETDSLMYEPLETTIEKCSRGPALRALMKKNPDLLAEGFEEPDMDKDFDETLTPGYDIVDAAQTMKQIGEAVATPRTTTSEAKQSEAKDEVKQGEVKAE